MNTEKKQFYRSVMSLVLPLAMQNLINVGVTSADVVMLGKVGETALSAASLANQVYFILSLVLFGLTSGACVITAQYWGMRDTRTIEKVMGMSFRIGVMVSFVATAAVWIAPKQIMRLFTNEDAVLLESIGYLKIVSLSYMISAFTNVYLNIVRSIERVVVATVIYSVSLVVNITLNAIFIFGLLGSPAMGIIGAALGTVCARLTEAVLVSIYAIKMNHVIRIHIKDLFVRDKRLGRDFRTYAMPVLLNELAWGVGMATITAIIGHLGSAAVAANSVVQVCRQLATVVSFGIASAASIMIGKVIGEKKEDMAKIYAGRFLKVSILLGIAGGIVILIISPIAISLLNLTPIAKSYMKIMMYIMSYYVVGQAFNSTMVVGICRAGGDTRFGLLLDVGVMWICSIAAGAFCAFVVKVPMPWVYVVLVSDEIIKIPFSAYRYRSLKWLNNITRS